MGKWTRAAKAVKKKWAARDAKATDMDALVSAIVKLPPGQLKKVLSGDVLAVLAKYGITLEEE